MDKEYVPYPGPKPFDYMWNPAARARYDARCAAFIRYWKRRDGMTRSALTRPLGALHGEVHGKR